MACTGLFATAGDNNGLGEAIAPYFKIIKNCKVAPSNGCFTSAGSHYYDSSSNVNWDTEISYKFITADGMSYMIYNIGGNCATNLSTGATGNMSQVCGQIYIDVNGPNKSPNRLGRDLYVFYITNGRGPLLYPYGGRDDNSSGNLWWKTPGTEVARYCTSTNTWGAPCPGRIMEEGWQMNY